MTQNLYKKIARRIPNPNDLAQTRIKYGMSQQQLADHLGVSRSLIMMAEQNKRELPTDALLKFSALEIRYAALTEQSSPAPASEPDLHFWPVYRKAFRQLKDRESYCRIKSLELERKLQQLETRYAACLDFMRLAGENPGEEMGDQSPATKKRWQRQMEAITERMRTCDPLLQALLRHRMEHLQAEAELNAHSLEKLTATMPGTYRDLCSQDRKNF